jgi:hypothetical protein
VSKIDGGFEALNRTRTPDLWGSIQQRQPRELSSDPSPGRRLGTVALALAVAVAGVTFGIRAFQADRVPVEPSSVPWADVPVGWTELPPPPEVRQGAAWVWTGTEILAWGGCLASGEACPPRDDGFAYDAVNGTWGSMPAAPVAALDPQAVWTGREAIFFDVGDENAPIEAVAFDPENGTWRTVPNAPITEAAGGVYVWTGSEIVAWGGGERDDPRGRMGAAYDPATDSWRVIAEAPIGLNHFDRVWTGREVLVLGSWLNDRNIAATKTAVGAAYDPVADEWRTLPDSDLSPQATAATWVNGRLVAYDYEVHWQAYDPGTDSWSAAVPMPMEFDECYPDLVELERAAFAFFCGQAATLGGDQWTQVQGGLLDATIEAGAGTYHLYRFADLVPAGEVLAFAAEGITVVGKDDTPCYGCPGSPHAFWVWRPEP